MAAGQSLTLVALVMPILLGLLLASLELISRDRTDRAFGSALSDTVRSVAQMVDYEQFAADGVMLDGDTLRAMATAAFIDRLRGMPGVGLTTSPEEIGADVVWTILPEGGTCTLSDGTAHSFGGPVICARVTIPTRGLIWAGTRMVGLDAVSTLDSSGGG
jgi:hypothetical protein